MNKQKGQTIPVYVKSNMHAYHVLKKHSEQSGISMSKYIRRGMECVALEQECSLQLTPSAYFAMQDGRFDVLTRTHLSDGTILISVTEDAYKSKDGTSGYEDKVQRFLNNDMGRKQVK